jgi:hypothetical protein
MNGAQHEQAGEQRRDPDQPRAVAAMHLRAQRGQGCIAEPGGKEQQGRPPHRRPAAREPEPEQDRQAEETGRRQPIGQMARHERRQPVLRLQAAADRRGRIGHSDLRQTLQQQAEAGAVHSIAQPELGELCGHARQACADPVAPPLPQQPAVEHPGLGMEARDPAEIGQQRGPAPVPEEVVLVRAIRLEPVQVSADCEIGTRFAGLLENARGVRVRLQPGEEEDGTADRGCRLPVGDEVGRRQRAQGEDRCRHREHRRAPHRCNGAALGQCRQEKPDHAGQKAEAQHQRRMGQVGRHGAEQQRDHQDALPGPQPRPVFAEKEQRQHHQAGEHVRHEE